MASGQVPISKRWSRTRAAKESECWRHADHGRIPKEEPESADWVLRSNRDRLQQARRRVGSSIEMSAAFARSASVLAAIARPALPMTLMKAAPRSRKPTSSAVESTSNRLRLR